MKIVNLENIETYFQLRAQIGLCLAFERIGERSYKSLRMFFFVNWNEVFQTFHQSKKNFVIRKTTHKLCN